MKWLYKVTNNINGKLYIGVSIDPERRWNQHRTMNTRASALKGAIGKYGSDNFSFDLLVCGEDDYIDELEVEAIQFFNTQTPNGYNITLGGDGATLMYWSESWNELLGTKPDRELAEELGSTIGIVSARRNGAGILSYVEQNKIDWTLYDHLLGTDSDINLANKTNLSTSSISYRRRELNIPRYTPPPKYDLPEVLISLLGKESDTSLSNKFSIPTGIIRKERVSLGIKEVTRGSWAKKRAWSEYEIEQLADENLSTDFLSRTLKISVTTIRNKRQEIGVKFKKKGNVTKYPLTEEMLKELQDTSLTYKYFNSKYGMDWSTHKRKMEQIKERKQDDKKE